MYLLYSALGLAEIFALFASAIAVGFLIVRAILRAIFVAKDETQKKARPEDLRQLKRAGQSGWP